MKRVAAAWKRLVRARHPSAAPPAEGHPYLQGRYAFERLFGDLARSRRNWQAVAITALAANVALTIGFIVLARAHTIVPYVVEVDALGEVRASAKLAQAKPPERTTQVALRRFVHNLRTVPSDLRLLNVQLGRAQAFVAGHALTTFTREVRGNSEELEHMLRRGETRYVDEISSILKVPGEAGVYRVAWRETDNIHHEQATRGYEGHFKVRIIAPDSPEILLDNPLGIFVTDYTWSETSSLP